jgi:diguanylate cyclase (GGDEF)-like protein/PAS domain S-box-containing protein
VNDVVASDASTPILAKETLEAVIESAHVALILRDSHGMVRLINGEAETVFGYARDELIGRPIDLLVPLPSRQAHAGRREGFLAAPAARRMGIARELFGLRKDGTHVPIEIALTPMDAADGPHTLSAIIDITQRRSLEQRFEDAVESAPVAMVMIDRRGRIVLVNRGTERLFGYDRSELLGEPAEMLLPERFRSTTANPHDAFLSVPLMRNKGIEHEFTGLCSDGTEVTIEVGMNPVHTEQGIFFVAAILDVTERNRLKAAQLDLEQRVLDHEAERERASRINEAQLAELRSQRARFKRLSREDPLTQIANRREFDERLDGEVQRAERLGTSLAVAMFDLDHFKQVNDRFGHAAGDKVLCEAADLMRRQCRSIDIVARYGGEEFALAFPATDAPTAAALCERIQRAFEQFDWSRVHSDLTMTISAGVCSWHPGAGSQGLLAEADACLYEAKRRGRNCVVMAAG